MNKIKYTNLERKKKMEERILKVIEERFTNVLL